MHRDRTLLIMLHGSGSSGVELRQYLSLIPLDSGEYRTFVDECKRTQIDLLTPTAPSRPYSPAAGECMSVWFDRSPYFQEAGVDDSTEEDTAGIEQGLSRLRTLLTELTADETFQHVFLGGFSMGGCLALHALSRLGSFQVCLCVLMSFSLVSVCAHLPFTLIISLLSFAPTCTSIPRRPRVVAA